MSELSNKSIVDHGCDTHAILCYGNAVVDGHTERNAKDFDNLGHGKRVEVGCQESEGKESSSASVVGCNANNDELGRTLNANNAVANGNDNYAGGFAQNVKEHLTSRPSRSKNTDNHVDAVSAGHGQTEYDSLPFFETDSEMNAENIPKTIWDELHFKNTKRKLKGLRKFYLNKEIVKFSVKRACKDKATKKKKYYFEHASEIADMIIKEISSDSYEVRGIMEVDLPKKHKTSKNRHAKIYDLYDRCIQNLILTIIEEKMRNKVVRNNYSNIKGRGILCNDKRFCMINKVRHAVMSYNDSHYLLTDVKKFYESIGYKVILRIISKTIKDKTTMSLLKKMFEASGDLPIGCALSPLIADVIMGDYDRIILSAFKPKFFAAFGDNRVYIGSKNLMCRIRSFTKAYYENHYHFKMKGDYQIGKVKDGVRFCKSLYKGSYVKVRGEIKRRAIRSSRNKESFASYCGMLNKSDSKHLINLIKYENNFLRSKRFLTAMDAKEFEGKKVPLTELVGKKIAITNFKKVDNGKESGYYIFLQFIRKLDDGSCETCNTKIGHHWIKQAYEEWVKNNEKFPIYVTVMQDGNSIYFKEYHLTNKDIAKNLIETLNIDLSKLG